ncbi:MAG: 50S ribosomal protein L25/general stress protein Ctc [Rickettsiales bacterium]|jgi:large subunit ribosomal protein L25|nr:50S ribosomal protein L25/general stress protein Ctc [Rickettsiales bacterium]
MSKIYALQGQERLTMGTGHAREVRRNKMVPAIIYGAGKPQVMLSLPAKELSMEYHKQGFLSHMFDISVGKNKYRVIPKEVQLHPVTDDIKHMDFMHVDKDTKIKVTVSVHIANEEKCPGIKQDGLLNVARHDLEIYCLPDNIPEGITIDISDLNIGDNIHLKDVKLPEGVECKLDEYTTIVAIVSAKKTEEITDAEGESESEGSTAS